MVMAEIRGRDSHPAPSQLLTVRVPVSLVRLGDLERGSLGGTRPGRGGWIYDSALCATEDGGLVVKGWTDLGSRPTGVYAEMLPDHTLRVIVRPGLTVTGSAHLSSGYIPVTEVYSGGPYERHSLAVLRSHQDGDPEIGLPVRRHVFRSDTVDTIRIPEVMRPGPGLE